MLENEKRLNPFQPNSMVVPGMFAGRVAELESIERGLYQTKLGNAWHFLIHGERGIGKSSLMSVTDYIACGEMTGPSDESFKFVTVTIEILPSSKLGDIISNIHREISKKIDNREKLKSLFKAAGDFLVKIEAMGVKFNNPESRPMDLAPDLADFCKAVCERLEGQIDGILIRGCPVSC